MKLLPIFGLLALVAVAYAIDCGKESSEEEDDKEFDEIAKKNKDLWDKVNKDQSKKQGFAFRPKTDADRKERFKQKAKEAKEANKKGDSTFCRKANEMDALDDDELEAEFTGIDKADIPSDPEVDSNRPEKEEGHGFGSSVSSLPQTVDHSAATGEVESQGGCGSCWAFCASHTVTGVVAKMGSKAVNDYSEQQLTDCVYPDKGGCQGGWPLSAFNYLKNKNLVAESKYPYTGKSGAGYCKENKISGSAFVTGGAYARGEQEMMKVVAKHPISIAMQVGKGGFGSYKSGVYDYSGSDCTNINHGMTAVGYGTENGVKYWLIKNSWGKNWGNKGYIKIRRGKDLCKIESYGMYPTVKAGGGGNHGGGGGGGSGEDKGQEDKTWKTFKNAKYMFPNVKRDFELGEQFCLQNGGHLATVNSEARHNVIYGIVKDELKLNEPVWIGANDRQSEGRWGWTETTASFSYTRWNSGQPGSGDCAAMVPAGRDYKWNAENCEREYKYLCVKFGEDGNDGGDKTTAKPDCKDDNNSCPHWKSYCGNHSYVDKNCKKTCGTCGGSPTTKATTPKPTTKPCKDENSGCPHWKSYCGNHSYVDKYCNKTCGKC